MQTTPPMKPMTSPYMGVVKPLAGVITTRPATAPEIAPSTVGLPVFSHSATTQPTAAAAAGKWVAQNARLARAFDATALPPLNPNHPTQRRQAPMNEITRLWGAMADLSKPMRGPRTSAQTSAETPELMWTTVPPAKSSAG